MEHSPIFSQPPVAETRTVLCSPAGKTIMRGKPMKSLSSKNLLIYHRSSSHYLTATRMGHPSTGCTRKPLNGNEDTGSILFTAYADC